VHTLAIQYKEALPISYGWQHLGFSCPNCPNYPFAGE
jgi:hypothetical protein